MAKKVIAIIKLHCPAGQANPAPPVGSSEPHRDKVGTVTQKDLEEIVEIKKADLNAWDLDAAKKIIAGTARSMGLEVEG